MLDRHVLPYLREPLTQLAKRFQAAGISANQVTVGGFIVGLLAMLSIANEFYTLGVFLVLINRLADGIDGALARLNGATDLGGYLDITLDFIFYGGIVFAFAIANPQANALAATFLLFSFMGTGSTFLAFSVMAAKRNLENKLYGPKSLYFLGGLTEGSETIMVFVLMCLLPNSFAVLAYLFGTACLITTATRLYSSYVALRD
ncbi:CDP-alcohol phosphatidyltransferase family protein [Maribrevibacterium harenarium]|uniref:CDP-alcohol phosphatidyltransferase family protein n=1 Tax=Maribrevibacterium harenarium TaxID=2589817 RepID=A0A501X236_9GAMM|nr:CDP-alcohol phosphatidyltransferase family protein [Maribrevibacterium harenarium]TPE54527.1 CDP-alcohol phosphatidyltransferase family protein [Maribrevibacterium harenarium]